MATTATHNSNGTAGATGATGATSAAGATGTNSRSTFLDENLDSFSGPSWNNSSEYPSLSSNEYAYDLHQLESLHSRIQALVSACEPMMKPDAEANGVDHSMLIPSLQAITEMEETAWKILGSMRTYAYCLNCIDGSNAEAQTALSKLDSISGKLEATTKPMQVYLTLAPEDVLTNYFKHAHTKPFEFQIRERRKYADTILGDKEEALIARLRSNGPSAWGTLYNQMASNLRCFIRNTQSGEVNEMGLARASGLLRDKSEAVRKAAWTAIQEAWARLAIPASAGLNALAGWRLEIAELRSKNRPVHYLEEALRSSKIEKHTLDAMMTAIQENIKIPRRAVRAMAKAQGKAQVDPWDLLAPAPLGNHAQKVPYNKGLAMIREAFDSVDPSFSDFIDTMKKNRWIEGRNDLPNKRQGAFCTGFAKSRSPRVYQTYMGSLEDVRTLAHELGHAYHSWVMRDLPLAQTHYPMTLAETASIFAETVFSDVLLEKAHTAGDTATAFELAWQNGESASALLLNIPARFDFETSFYDKRQEGFVSPEQLSKLTSLAWEKWYGETLSQPEQQFWMTKLHFSIAGLSFYNFPYAFGYLFSLGVYALRAEKGDSFWSSYTDLLRDTGRMTAEELAMKHLGVDLTKPDFWRKSIAIVDTQVRELETLISQRSH